MLHGPPTVESKYDYIHAASEMLEHVCRSRAHEKEIVLAARPGPVSGFASAR